MRTIIYDISKEELKNLKIKGNDYLINAKECNAGCVGCFSCWIKNPMNCAIKDEFSSIVSKLKESSELILISKCNYGCYSDCIKRVLERCIGYVLPYFTVRDGRIHHMSRFKKKMEFKVIFYGDNVSQEDKIYATNLVKANSINLNTNKFNIDFVKDVEGIKSVLTC